jgi:hypothetical protein
MLQASIRDALPVLLKLLPAGDNCRRSGGAFVMVNTAVELEVLEK